MRPAGRRAAPQTARPQPSAEMEAPFKRRKRHPEEPGQFAIALVIIYRTLGQLLPECYDPDRRSLRCAWLQELGGGGAVSRGFRGFHKSESQPPEHLYKHTTQ